MPISTWQMRKCVKCGARVPVLMGDNLVGGDLLPFVCVDCRKKAAEDRKQEKKRPFRFF